MVVSFRPSVLVSPLFHMDLWYFIMNDGEEVGDVTTCNVAYAFAAGEIKFSDCILFTKDNTNSPWETFALRYTTTQYPTVLPSLIRTVLFRRINESAFKVAVVVKKRRLYQ